MAVERKTAAKSIIDEIEITLLLEGVLMRYGYDFRYEQVTDGISLFRKVR